MASYTIKNVSNTSFLTSGEKLVYGGKKGATALTGSIPVLCNTYSSNATSIVFSIPSLYQLIDDNTMKHILELPCRMGSGKLFATMPISQYAPSTYKVGSVGFTNYKAYATSEILTHNLQANTITVSTVNASNPISDYLIDLPFYVYLNQPILTCYFANNVMFISGTEKVVSKTYNIVGETDTYSTILPISTRSRNQITAYLDSIETDEFTWSSNSTATDLIFSLNDNYSQLRIDTDYYTAPAIEANDFISFASSANSYKVVNTSYQFTDAFYDADLTSSYLYKIKLDKPITANVGESYITNLSRDLEGTAGNITSNSFSIDYRDDYPFTYSLANKGIYYVYQKNKLRKMSAKPDKDGIIKNVPTGTYLVQASTVNRFNRSSDTVSKILNIEPIRLSKVQNIDISEQVFIDTTGGASITALVSFDTIKNADVTHYNITYRIISDDATTDQQEKYLTVENDETVNTIEVAINNLTRGRTVGSNTLSVTVTPANGVYAAFPSTTTKTLIGKTEVPSGLSGLNIAQQGEFLNFSWRFQQTIDGYIQDLDTKEVEIREYPGLLNTIDQNEVQAVWPLSLVIERIPFPSTFTTIPIKKYGQYTYLLKVRDTSDNDSEIVAASSVTLVRLNKIKVFKAYSEHAPETSYIVQDGVSFPNSNVHVEDPFPSVTMTVNNGLVLSDSTLIDNANGSASSFTVDGDLITAQGEVSSYTTQVRDLGQHVRGTIKIGTKIIVGSPNTTFESQYVTVLEGVSDGLETNVLVDTSFGGIGSILGYNNANAASTSYNSFHRTLTSGSTLGNVYAIRNPGQFSGDTANANSYCLIAGVVNANAIALGEFYYANGTVSSSNTFSNVTVSGNTYQLVNLVQYGDEEASSTFLGEERAITQNIYIRTSESNVFYLAASNGSVGTGNVNVSAFTETVTDTSDGYKNYVVGDQDLRYLQIKVEFINRSPNFTSVSLEELSYEIELEEKTINKKVNVNVADNVAVNYAYANLALTPNVTASLLDSNWAYTVLVSDVSNTSCNVRVIDSSNTAVDTEIVTLTVRGI